MKTLIIVFRDSMLSELEQLLNDNGVNAYTILSHVMGKGVTGQMHGTFLQPETNAIIFSVLSPDLADRAIRVLQTFHAGRLKAKHGQPVPLKVFTFPCEEHV